MRGIVVLLLTLLTVTAATAQDKTAPATPTRGKPAQAAPAQPAAPTPTSGEPGTATEPETIPLAEVSVRAEKAIAGLREMDALLTRPAAIEVIERELPSDLDRLARREEETRAALSVALSLTVLDALADGWQSGRGQILSRLDALSARATRLEQERARVEKLADLWRRTRDSARAAKAPPVVARQVDSVLARLDDTLARLTAERDAALELQGRLAPLNSRIEAALDAVQQARSTTLSDLFVRDSPPIWSPEALAGAVEVVPFKMRDILRDDSAELADYLAVHPWRLGLQLVSFVLLGVMFRRARAGARGWKDESALSAATVFDSPFAAALIVTAVSSLWLYPAPPRLTEAVVTLLVIAPVCFIARRIVPARVRPALYLLSAIYVVDRVRDLTAIVPLLARGLFLVEAAVGALAAALFLASGRLAAAAEEDGPRPALLRGATALGLVLLAGAFVAGAVGYVRLAEITASAFFRLGYRTLMIYVGLRVLIGLVAYALRARPLRLLYGIQHHRPLVERRTRAVLSLVAVAVWLDEALGVFQLSDRAQALAQAALSFDLAPGPLVVTLADLLLFGATVWAAFLASAFLRFVLDEDVYPRVRMARGVPYTVSAVLHYVILLSGFLFAVTMLGVDLNRVTLLAGALGVGIGFGLQGVVNNFVSGLILLFERPVKPGDSVQLGDLSGAVTRIGMRSSTVRTWDGAEVIVPNATLTGERVINWTLSDRMRRIDLKVGVAYGTAPERVLELLVQAARAQPGVVAEPAPQALFVGFGDSALEFELRAWTARFEDWMPIRSALGVAVYAALTEAKIEIPFPQRDVHVRGPDVSA